MLQLDMLTFTMKQRAEQDEMIRKEEEENRKPPREQFEEHLFDQTLLEKLQPKIADLLTPYFKKLTVGTIDEHPSIAKLFELAA